MHAGAGTVLLQQIALPTRKRPRAEGTGSSTEHVGGGGQGEKSGSHPAALSEDVRATAWKPVALEGKRTR